MMTLKDELEQALQTLKKNEQYRQIPTLAHDGRYVVYQGKRLLNIASNDYLGLGSDSSLQRAFFEQMDQLADTHYPKMSATCLLYTSPSPRDRG